MLSCASALEWQKEIKWSQLKPQVFVFVTMILQRCGNDGDPLAFFIPTEVNPNPIDQARELYNIQTFGQFVIYGFFFYILLQIISIIFDDKSPVMVRLFHISIIFTRSTRFSNQFRNYEIEFSLVFNQLKTICKSLIYFFVIFFFSKKI